jgi:hypothetical protein
MAALAGIIAGVLWYCFRTPESPTFVLLSITEYRNRHLPPNSWAEQDREILNTTSWTDAYQSQEEHQLPEQLRTLETQDNKKPLVFYLSGLALPDARGELCLLPGDADEDNAKGHWMPMSKILDKVIACPAPHKLLILDIMRPIADPRLGVLGNDVASRLQPMVEKAVADHPELLILCACAPGQVSLGSEALGRSVFGNYVEEGLRGRADGYNEKNERDGKVTAWELARFVSARVDRWSQMNRKDARQTPVMHGAATADFDLVFLKDGKAQEHLEANAEWLNTYPDWLQKGWAQRDDWWKKRTYRRAPRAFRELEVDLLRAERRWRGGVKTDLKEEFRKDRAAVEEQAKQAEAALPVPPRLSLAQAIAQGQEPNPKTREDLNKLLSGVKEPSASSKPEEAKLLEQRKQFLDPILKDREKKDKNARDKDDFELAEAVFHEAVRSSTQPRIKFMYELLRDVQPEPRYVETLWLYRLYQLETQVKDDWPADGVRRSLEVVRDGESAAVCDPHGQGRSEARAFPWVQNRLDVAAQMRHDGEVQLLAHGYASPDKATKLLEQAAAEYHAIHEYLDILTQAYDEYDRTLALLPGLLPYLMAQPSLDAQDEKSWKDALDSVRELYALWTLSPTALYQKRNDLRDKAHDLGVHLDHFTKLIGTQQAELKTELDQTEWSDAPGLLAKIDLLLELPWLEAADRAKLWAARAKVAEQAQDRTTKLDRAEDDEREVKQTPRPREVDVRYAEAAEQQRAFRRAQLLWMFLRASGLPEDPELDKMLEGHGPDLAGLPTLGTLLRKAWAEGLPRQFEKDANLPAQDLLSRAAHPLDPFPILTDASTNPSVRLQQDARKAQSEWLGQRCVYEKRDLPGLGDDKVAAEFYDAAAHEFDVKVGILPMHFTGPPETPDLQGDRTRVQSSFKLMLEAPGLTPEKVEREHIHPMLADGDMLKVDVEKVERLAGMNAVRVPLIIKLNSASRSSGPLPRGFLVAVQTPDGPLHYRMNVLLQESAEKRVQVLVSENSNAGDSSRKLTAQSIQLRVRPNKQQPVYVFIRNPTDKDRNLVVEVTAEGGEAKLESKPRKVAAGKTEQIAFEGKASAAADKPPAAADKPPDGLMPLPEQGTLLVKVLDAGDNKKEVDKKRVEVKVASPRDYVDAEMTYEPHVEGKMNRLKVLVRPTPELTGEKCHVKMELNIPGFKKAAGLLPECDLTPGSEKGETLILEGLEFDENRDEENGEVYLTVDDCPRAIIFKTTFAVGSRVRPKAERVYRPRLRLTLPTRAVTALASVGVQVDNAPQSDVKVRVSFQRDEGGELKQQGEPLPGDHWQEVKFGGGKDGLLFQTVVRDHSIVLKTATILGGKRQVKAELIDETGAKIVADTKTLLVDNTKPENVRILRIGEVEIAEPQPGQVPDPVKVEVKEAALVLQVSATGSNPYSGIDEVTFFFGKPEKDKPPATATVVTAKRQDGKDVWTASLRLERMGQMDVSACFKTGAGLERIVTMPINLVTKAAPQVGTIKGTVTYDGNPQDGLTVLLQKKNAKMQWMDVDSKVTKNGDFVFTDVSPGEYKVSTGNTLAEGFKEVEVKPGPPIRADIVLMKKP